MLLFRCIVCECIDCCVMLLSHRIIACTFDIFEYGHLCVRTRVQWSTRIIITRTLWYVVCATCILTKFIASFLLLLFTFFPCPDRVSIEVVWTRLLYNIIYSNWNQYDKYVYTAEAETVSMVARVTWNRVVFFSFHLFDNRTCPCRRISWSKQFRQSSFTDHHCCELFWMFLSLNIFEIKFMLLTFQASTYLTMTYLSSVVLLFYSPHSVVAECFYCFFLCFCVSLAAGTQTYTNICVSFTWMTLFCCSAREKNKN